ncbi:triphosphoribosyl-dephospho-CoA synthase [bacterium]|nr:triphosphoribosyl-dephospho-CoA synthase [bacterium]
MNNIEAILNAREKRFEYQRKLLKKEHQIITFSLTPPGNRKNTRNYEKYFFSVGKLFEKNFRNILRISHNFNDKAGYENIYILKKMNGELKDLKRRFIEFENTHVFNITDIDILFANNKNLKRADIGVDPRKCIVCNKGSSKICMTKNQHSINEVKREYNNRVERFLAKENIKKVLVNKLRDALTTELNTTPKHGLVDPLDSGIHEDMDHALFEVSIDIICRDIFKIFDLGSETIQIEKGATLKEIRSIGKKIEDAMFKRTNGVNTLKGGIFIFSFIFFTLGYLYFHKSDIFSIEDIIHTVKSIAEDVTEELKSNNLGSYSKKCFDKYGITGIRGEIENGFPTIVKLFNEKFQYKSLNELNLRRFLFIFKHCEDTQVIKNIGIKMYKEIQKNIEPHNPNIHEEIDRYGNYVKKYFYSAGGTADLLALFIFLDSVKKVDV